MEQQKIERNRSWKEYFLRSKITEDHVVEQKNEEQPPQQQQKLERGKSWKEYFFGGNATDEHVVQQSKKDQHPQQQPEQQPEIQHEQQKMERGKSWRDILRGNRDSNSAKEDEPEQQKMERGISLKEIFRVNRDDSPPRELSRGHSQDAQVVVESTHPHPPHNPRPRQRPHHHSHVPVVHGMRGLSCGVLEPKFLVIRQQAAYEALCNSMDSLNPYKRPNFMVDFTSETVAAIFMGQKPTGGYQVHVIRVADKGDTIVLYYRTTEPRPDLGEHVPMMPTQPFHLLVFKNVNKEVRFKQVFDNPLKHKNMAIPLQPGRVVVM